MNLENLREQASNSRRSTESSRADGTHVIAVLLLLAVCLLERASHYGARALIVPWLVELGVENDVIAGKMSALVFGGQIAALLGGVAGMLAGARRTVVAGIVIAVCGTAAMAFSSADGVLVILVVGQALAKPCLFVWLGMEARRLSTSAQLAAAAALYGAIWMGAAGGSSVTALRAAMSLDALFLLSAALGVGALVLLAGAWFAGRWSGDPAPAERPVRSAFMLLLLLAPVLLLQSLGSGALHREIGELEDPSWVAGLALFAEIALVPIGVAALAVFSGARIAVPVMTVLVGCIGAVLAGSGLALFGGGTVLLGLSAFLAAVGEVGMFSATFVLLSGVRSRFAPFLVASWLALTALASAGPSVGWLTSPGGAIGVWLIAALAAVPLFLGRRGLDGSRSAATS